MDTTKQLIREFHVLLHRCGITDDGKQTILSAYGVESSKELPAASLAEINGKLRDELRRTGLEPKPRKQPIDTARSRVKAAVGAYLAKMGKIPPSGWGPREWNLICAVACRAARADSFNGIPLAKLNQLYNAFRYGSKALDNVEELTKELLHNQQSIINN